MQEVLEKVAGGADAAEERPRALPVGEVGAGPKDGQARVAPEAYSKSLVTSYELQVTSYELRVT